MPLPRPPDTAHPGQIGLWAMLPLQTLPFRDWTDFEFPYIYDYVVTDSKVERDFVTELDTSQEVAVYAKLPRGFFIPTPVGDYNPDWAIAFKEGVVKHVYFVAETKGSMSSLELRAIEKTKIQCARKFFDELNRRYAPENVKYDVVDSFAKLMEVVR